MPRPAKSRPAKTHPAVWRVCTKAHTEKENKNITFNFFQDITSVNIEGLKKGRYDIIFGSYSPDENGIDFVPIIRQEIVAILPPGHPLTLKDTMELSLIHI